MVREFCIHCGKPISGKRIRLHALYCCIKCRVAAKSMRVRQNIKNNNPEKYEYRLARGRERVRKWRAKQKENNNCIRCGNPNDRIQEGCTTCSECEQLTRY